MRLVMSDGRLQTVERVRQFLKGSEVVEFSDLTAREKRYWIEEVLRRFEYHLLLLIHFTKSRPRQTDDNGLVETKNGSVLRKNLGYAHIPQACAESLNRYHSDYLDPYINFHRPCFFPQSVIDHRGRIKKTYPYEEVMTPYERLRNVPRVEGYLRPGVSLEKLATIANQTSDNQFAERMVNARSKLFQQITRFAQRVA